MSCTFGIFTPNHLVEYISEEDVPVALCGVTLSINIKTDFLVFAKYIQSHIQFDMYILQYKLSIKGPFSPHSRFQKLYIFNLIQTF